MRLTGLLITLERVLVVLHAATRRVMKSNLTAGSSTLLLTKNAPSILRHMKCPNHLSNTATAAIKLITDTWKGLILM